MQEALNLNADTDMNEWFMERDIKMPGVIYHDKLISDALLGQTPIKSEHSYSLNSDGDSIPDSPRSLQNKIDGKFSRAHTNDHSLLLLLMELGIGLAKAT